MSARKHLAVRWYGRDGLKLSCRCGSYTPIAGTVREQEDAHRAHRTVMGETVRPRTPSKLDRAYARIAELETENAELARALGLNEEGAT